VPLTPSGDYWIVRFRRADLKLAPGRKRASSNPWACDCGRSGEGAGKGGAPRPSCPMPDWRRRPGTVHTRAPALPWTARDRFATRPRLRGIACGRHSGRIAQLVEQLTLNQRVLGSSPSAPTNQIKDLRGLDHREDPLKSDWGNCWGNVPASLLRGSQGLRLNEHLGAPGRRRVSSRLRHGPRGHRQQAAWARYRSGRSPDWINFKNQVAPAVRREAEEWGKERWR